MRAIVHYEVFMPTALICDEPKFPFSLDDMTIDVLAVLLSESNLKLYKFRALWVAECTGIVSQTNIKLECKSDTASNALTGLVKRYIEFKLMFEGENARG